MRFRQCREGNKNYMAQELQIWISGWVYDYFAPEINSYCDILLNRVLQIFDDLDGEQTKACNDFLRRANRSSEDYEAMLEAAYDHALDHTMQFAEMRSVFLAAGVSGLFHLFERQLYKHINKELRRWLQTPIANWQDIEEIIPQFNQKFGESAPCLDLINAFRDFDLQELKLVANSLKHGDDGPSYRQLVSRKAIVVDKERLEKDGHAGPFSILKVNLSLEISDVERYREAIARFWSLDGTYCADRSAFK